jgi:transposase
MAEMRREAVIHRNLPERNKALAGPCRIKRCRRAVRRSLPHQLLGILSRDRGGLHHHRRLHRHGGGKPDTRPQAIDATGAKGPYLTLCSLHNSRFSRSAGLSRALEGQGQPLLFFDGAIYCLDFLLERLQLGSVAGAIAVPDLKATCPHCVASMVHVTDSFASSRDQDFPKLFKTFNVIASHCVLLFRRHRRLRRFRTAKNYDAEALKEYRRFSRQSMSAEAQI